MTSKLRYMKVADAIRNSILDGIHIPGDRLPRQHELAKEHQVAFNTLKQALDLLSHEGYIVRKVGQGTYASLPQSHAPIALVVDDDAQIREILTRGLAEYRWDSVAVDSAEAALELLEDRSFDLIFLDLMMAGMNGAEACKQIRGRDPSAQVVIVTGYPDSNLLAAALMSGPLGVMLKPFTMGELHGVLGDRESRISQPLVRS